MLRSLGRDGELQFPWFINKYKENKSNKDNNRYKTD